MAYAGTTSTAANPPFVVDQMIAGSTNTGSTDRYARKTWMYRSTHTQAEAAASGFFTDGDNLGMKLSDTVLVVGSTTYVVSHHAVREVTSTGVTISAGLLVSSAS